MGTGEDRLVRRAEFLAELGTDPTWSERDIMTVRTRVSLIRKEFKSDGS
jgi:hypothetical protein